MLSFVLGAVLAGTAAPCADLLVANPKLQVVRAVNRGFDNVIVTVDVRNDGAVGQPRQTRQHLEIVQRGAVLGTQPVPPLGPSQSYPAAFRIQFPHAKHHDPLDVTFRYVLDGGNAAQANCSTRNDLLHAVLS
ncbi:MAG: hypothetical protein ABR975_10930 [Vulcanimicrobiaceae bacterium]|jgi:hypothetical protein